MNRFITLGGLTISVSTAYKVAVLGFLTTIVGSLAYIIYWLST